MTTLSFLSTEVFEALLDWIHDHHVARLMLTGDVRLAAAVKSVRRMSFGRLMSAVPVTPLVKQLVALSSRVRISTLSFDEAVATGISLTRIRRLILTHHREDGLYGPPFSTKRLDLSPLASLEAFELGGLYSNGPILFPLSIQKIAIGRIVCHEPIADLHKLTTLHTLKVYVCDDYRQAFMEQSVWPDSLTRLSVNLGVEMLNEHYYDTLPRTVTQLAVACCTPTDEYYEDTASDVNSNLDIALICARTPLLTSLAIDRDDVPARITGPLPPTLTQLAIRGTLEIVRGVSVATTIGYIPSSVTSFSFGHVWFGERRRPDVDALCVALKPLLWRMPFSDVERVFAAMHAGDATEMPIVAEVMQARFGIPPSYLRLFDNVFGGFKLLNRSDTLYATDAAQLVELGLDEARLDLLLANKRVYAGKHLVVGDHASAGTRAYALHCTHLLETDRLNFLQLGDETCHVLPDADWTLSEGALRNTTSLFVANSCSAYWLDCVLRANTFECVRRIRVNFEPLEDAVRVICNNRRSLPNLAELRWEYGRLYQPSDDIRSVLSSMRLHLHKDGYRFVYRV